MQLLGLPIVISDRLPPNQVVLGSLCLCCRGCGTVDGVECSTCLGVGAVGVKFTDVGVVRVS